MEIDYAYIGKRISRERKAVGLTQSALADFADSSPQYISHIENGRKKASLDILVRIANVLNISMDRLLGRTINNNRSDCGAMVDELLSGCNSYERTVMIDVAVSLRDSLKENRKKLLDDYK